MAFNASVRFTGLCAFVPNSNGKSVRCLLVNARFGGGLVENPAHAHTPLIEFDVRDLEPPLENMPQPVFEVVDGFKGIWILNNDDIDLLPVGGKNDFEFPDSGDIGEEPVEANKHLMAWVPHIKRVSTGTGSVKDNCLRGNSEDLRRRVVARLRVNEGKFRTSRHTKQAGSYLRWEFKVNEGGTVYRTQTIGEEVELKLSGLDELVFNAKYFSEERPSRQLRLKNKTGKPQLEVSIKNVELEEVSTVVDADTPSVFEDFVYFYDLAADSNLERSIPHKVPNPHIALSRPICPGAVFDAHPEA